MSYLVIYRTVRSIRRSVFGFKVRILVKKKALSRAASRPVGRNTLRVDHVDLLQLLSIAY